MSAEALHLPGTPVSKSVIMPWGHSVPTLVETVPILELDGLSLCQHTVSKPQVVQLDGMQLSGVSAFGWELQSGHGTTPLCPEGPAQVFLHWALLCSTGIMNSPANRNAFITLEYIKIQLETHKNVLDQ